MTQLTPEVLLPPALGVALVIFEASVLTFLPAQALHHGEVLMALCAAGRDNWRGN